MVVAPDKFKGTLTATEAASQIALGVRDAVPEADIELIPLADGGEGTLSALIDDASTVESLPTVDSWGRPLMGTVAITGNRDAIVEMSCASGVRGGSEASGALGASTIGSGRLIAAAVALQVQRLLVGIGGSATTDGGTGAATALGWRFLDRKGRELRPGGGNLHSLHAIDGSNVRPLPEIVGLCDVPNALLGARGAARTFGPQKGANSSDVDRLEEGLARLAHVVETDLGIEIATLPMGGAGGGMGAGLVAFMGGRLTSGFEVVAEKARLAEKLATAHLVITAEGRFDETSVAGKVTSGVARAAAHASIPCWLVAGEISAEEGKLVAAGFSAWAACADRSAEALRTAARSLAAGLG